MYVEWWSIQTEQRNNKVLRWSHKLFPLEEVSILISLETPPEVMICRANKKGATNWLSQQR